MIGLQKSWSQSRGSYKKLSTSLNQYVHAYNRVNPAFEDYYYFDSLDLTKKDLKRIQDDYREDENALQDSIEALNLLYYLENNIKETLNKMINHPDFKSKRFIDIDAQGGDFNIVESNDKKLYNFSLDEKTGGTYRSRTSWMYYTEMDSIQRIYKINNPYEKLNRDGYGRIHALETDEGTKYILTGFVRGCSYCFETFVALVRLDKGEFKYDFNHSVNLRDWEGGIEYHPETKTITVDYITDDLTQDCNCEDTENEDYEEEEYMYEEKHKEKKCHCTFQFNGNNFELIKVNWEKVK